MEEKNTIKMSLSTFFLILAIIAICVMGFFIYKLSTDKRNATEQVSELNNRVTLLESAKNEPKETVIEKNNVNTSTETSKNTVETDSNVESTASTVNTAKKTYSYSDLKGAYESQTINMNEGTDGEAYNGTFKLELSEKGTFEYCDIDIDCRYIGYYTITDNKITLNSVVFKANDPSAHLSNQVAVLDINNDGTIVDSEKKMFGSNYKESFKFSKKSETLSEEINIAKFIDQYLAGCGTSGKDGQGPWFTGLEK